ncbi:MAG TPA: hypothetical protein DEA78_20765 [Cyanobacteria bacterium UBA11159]|nr:hypothetical protein [Cyanobacteria bacterium UBA11367]HBE59708.1 hypothetical protein [Cyanobacteria bacterium UBA11366]HBR76063.1 hypothetical protein [Cyanobacteria bacterium UBA11159]HBS72664.1 hypothetical protein [Cyanobacteria bacterium UBA11153]HCA96166.1 hypothetical protein [Cyanobacteria bacterium UBA9226]
MEYFKSNGLGLNMTNNSKFSHLFLSLTVTVSSLTGLLLPLSGVAEQWVRVKTDNNNNSYYIDVSTIEGKGRFRYFWSNVIYGEPYRWDNKLVYSTSYYISVDCSTKLYRVRFEQLLDAQGKSIQDLNYGDNGRSGITEPGSPEDASLLFVCEN